MHLCEQSSWPGPSMRISNWQSALQESALFKIAPVSHWCVLQAEKALPLKDHVVSTKESAKVDWDIKADISQGAPPLLPGIPTKPFTRETLPQANIDPAHVQHSAVVRKTAWDMCQREASGKVIDERVLKAVYRWQPRNHSARWKQAFNSFSSLQFPNHLFG